MPAPALPCSRKYDAHSVGHEHLAAPQGTTCCELGQKLLNLLSPHVLRVSSVTYF